MEGSVKGSGEFLAREHCCGLHGASRCLQEQLWPDAGGDEEPGLQPWSPDPDAQQPVEETQKRWRPPTSGERVPGERAHCPVM